MLKEKKLRHLMMQLQSLKLKIGCKHIFRHFNNTIVKCSECGISKRVLISRKAL